MTFIVKLIIIDICCLQVQYHTSKKIPTSSACVEGMLRDLQRDVERREHFLRECGRMVGAFPELEEEVSSRAVLLSVNVEAVPL